MSESWLLTDVSCAGLFMTEIYTLPVCESITTAKQAYVLRDKKCVFDGKYRIECL